VADDEVDIVALLEYRLRREGYGVVTANEGEAALRVARERLPDLALVDVRMPKRDGYQVVAEIRRDPRLSRMPVIMLSASIKQTDIQKSHDAGADDHLGKPFSPDALIRCVRTHLERRADETSS
jgi:DNA-binding response OmpR family regulator